MVSGSPIAGEDGLHFILSDHALRSSTTRTIKDGVGSGQMKYDAWGESRPGGSLPTSYQYTGQRAEIALGILYYRSRWYDPTLNPTQQIVVIETSGNTINGILDGVEFFHHIRVPIIGVLIDGGIQAYRDLDQSYSISQRILRSGVVAVEGQGISYVSIQGFGLGLAVGIESGPGVVLVGAAGYGAVSIILTRAADSLNESYIFPLINQIAN